MTKTILVLGYEVHVPVDTNEKDILEILGGDRVKEFLDDPFCKNAPYRVFKWGSIGWGGYYKRFGWAEPHRLICSHYTNGISPVQVDKRLTHWGYHYTPEELYMLLHGVKIDTPDGEIWHYPLNQNTYEMLDKFIDEQIIDKSIK